MIVFHGTRADFDGPLEPRFIAGANGSQDGIGINATSSLRIAKNYAGEDGFVHVAEMNLDGFLVISNDQRLTKEQAENLEGFIGQLDDTVRTRLSTDLMGKKEYSFTDKNEAKEFLDRKKKELKDMSLYLDRMKPSVEYFEDGDYVISAAHKEVDLKDVSTEHIHYILNLLDNYLATNALKSISTGLVLERGEHSNYLSFRYQESVIKKFPASEIESVLSKEMEEELSFEQ